MGNGNSFKHLKTKEVNELIKSTKFTVEEIHKWHGHFVKECPKGRLGKVEFQDIYSHVFPLGNPEKFSGFVFNVFDKNGDGTISFQEFIMALSITSRGNVDEKLDWAFKLYDIDKDGHISREEMTEIISAIVEMVGPNHGLSTLSAKSKANQIFDSMDCNKDGYLTADEFRICAKKDPWIVHALAMDPAYLHR
ncbi:ncs-3 [Bugula neritina]|uniref:Ncs-3 n=1 Tax=Bugula neritina TaxID=10212 RepID=A0A7J7KNB7_BUGNE|nr:ncs-3 [Bugula neritina]